MRITWGLKIAILYCGFAALIITLVVGSSRQKFDLVSKSYYEDEIKYQDVIDANKNGLALSNPVTIHADEKFVFIEFPMEFKSKQISGQVYLYSPVNAKWDKKLKISAVNNSMKIDRSGLQKVNYLVKITMESEGKKYYHEAELNLRK